MLPLIKKKKKNMKRRR